MTSINLFLASNGARRTNLVLVISEMMTTTVTVHSPSRRLTTLADWADFTEISRHETLRPNTSLHPHNIFIRSKYRGRKTDVPVAWHSHWTVRTTTVKLTAWNWQLFSQSRNYSNFINTEKTSPRILIRISHLSVLATWPDNDTSLM